MELISKSGPVQSSATKKKQFWQGHKRQQRGAAMGGFLAFFDLSFCIAIPIAGTITNGNNYQAVYFIGTSAALMGVWIAWKLLPDKSLHKSSEELTTNK